MTPYYRSTRIEINVDALVENIQTFRRQLPSTTEVMAVVKANAYGHGAEWIARMALEAGATQLGVAFIDEAIMLRKSGISAPILIMGYSSPEAMIQAVDYDIEFTVGDELSLIHSKQIAEQKRKHTHVHIKFDTGMGRLGFTDQSQLLSLLQQFQAHDYLKLKGLFTHLACADEEDQTHTNDQLQHFQNLVDLLSKAGVCPPVRHALNSAGAIQYAEMAWDMARIGVGMYGLSPSTYLKGKIDLTPVLSFKTNIVQLKTVPIGTTISYGATYRAGKPTIIATLPVGYADGYNRRFSNCGEVLIHGIRVPIVGKICMDQIMVDVSELGNVAVGDEVVLYGRQGKEEISIDEMASKLGTINYEISCALNFRVPRVYFQEGRIIAVTNKLW